MDGWDSDFLSLSNWPMSIDDAVEYAGLVKCPKRKLARVWPEEYNSTSSRGHANLSMWGNTPQFAFYTKCINKSTRNQVEKCNILLYSYHTYVPDSVRPSSINRMSRTSPAHFPPRPWTAGWALKGFQFKYRNFILSPITVITSCNRSYLSLGIIYEKGQRILRSTELFLAMNRGYYCFSL